MARTSPIPPGRTGAIPYLCVAGAKRALDFYTAAFGARTTVCIAGEDDRIGHAELQIGAAEFMLADEFPELGFVAPRTLGGTTITLHVYVDDVDAFVERAVAAGATLERPLTDQFYGDRNAQLVDPFGHRWAFASRIEEVSLEEMMRRAADHSG